MPTFSSELSSSIKQTSNYEKNVIPDLSTVFMPRYLFNLIRFHFRLVSREFPAIRVQPIAAVRGMRQTDRRTDRHNAPTYAGRKHNYMGLFPVFSVIRALIKRSLNFTCHTTD